jgi:regulatory protein
MDKNSPDSVKQYAFRLLAASPRTKGEIAGRLREKGASRDVTAGVIETLERAGYVDDERFARDFIQSKMRTNPAGRKYFMAEFSRRKVDMQTVEKVLEEVLPPESEYEAACEAARKASSRFARLEEGAKLKKVYGHLLRRGFSGETAGDIITKSSGGMPED